MKVVQILAFALFLSFVMTQDEPGNACIEAFMALPSHPDVFQWVGLNSGKGLNDLGQMQACDNNKKTKYILLNLKMMPVYQGLCVPVECNHETLKPVLDAINGMINPTGTSPLVAQFIIPSDDRPGVSFGNAFGFVFFGLLFLVCLFGIVVEYTTLFGTQFPEGYDEMNDGAKDKALVKSKNNIGKLFLSFSFSRNIRKTFWAPAGEDDNLSVFNGIRVLSMTYIILGHIHEILPILPITNGTQLQGITKSFYAVFVSGGFYSVDVFFFMSSFLGAYLMIDKFKGSKFPNFGMIYFHRLFRLLPPLILFTCMFMTFYAYLGYGPLYSIVADFYIEGCKRSSWKNFIFINNVYQSGMYTCMGQLWYLANDMQFFIILPWIIYAYIKNRIAGYVVTYVLLAGNVITTFIISHVGEHSMSVINDTKQITNIYHMPYTRVGAYLIGVLFGIWYYEYKASAKDPNYNNKIGAVFFRQVYLNRGLRWSYYIIGAFFMVLLLCIPYTETKNMPKRTWSQISCDFFN